MFRLGIILFFLLTHQQAVELTTGQYSIIVLTIELVKQWHYFHNNAIMHSTYDADTYRHTFSSNMWCIIICIYIYISRNLLYTSLCFNHDTSHHISHHVWLEKVPFIAIWLTIYIYTGWWFQTFFIFHNIWDNPSHWLIFFKMVKATNQYIIGWLERVLVREWIKQKDALMNGCLGGRLIGCLGSKHSTQI